ncbi:Rnf-Nqr domain containing protein [Pseudomonas inefficax]|jgi:electron transport complex protein RnfE|uniref:Rnf-Nqr domain containing protein n=1 Tax=Pseudomonas TaxID=286 RepID=UPI000DC45046|nr:MULTISPECIES: Rnf-Nqr domain containing protein [Pseudomonas]MCM8913298.1 NADH:quinone oxidoreductase [Pseudomonas inefficax]RAM73907.1 NADH:quinone oxidoreductase [Pseudomonas putida]WNN40819.1 Rnf-Nqr domain containing protein [Pseudomonas inefficax]
MTRFYLLGASLVPLLGATRTLSEGATIGVCAVLMSSLHQLLLAPLRQRLATWTYVLASLLVLAALASCLQLALRAWLLPLALALGHYPALLCLQCLAIDHLLPGQGRWRVLAGHHCALLATCLLLGASRQWLADGTGLHLATLAPGGLLLLGLLLALYNRLRPGPAQSHRQGKL